MKLTDLNPGWVGAGGAGISDAAGNPVQARKGIGLCFDCPCGCGVRCFVPFSNPLDGGPQLETRHDIWQRTGDDFATLTLHPSIKRNRSKGGCGWHGWIKAGEVTGKVEP